VTPIHPSTSSSPSKKKNDFPPHNTIDSRLDVGPSRPPVTMSDPMPVPTTRTSKLIGVAEWKEGCKAFGISVIDPATLPFAMGNDIHAEQLRLAQPMRTHTPMRCWFCLRNTAKDGVEVYQTSPTAQWECYPWPVWMFCFDCRDHAHRSAAVYMATQKVAPIVALAQPVKVKRTSGEIQGGWSFNHLEHAWAEESTVIAVVVKGPPGEKKIPLADVLAVNPGLVVTLNFPAHYPLTVAQFFRDALAAVSH
jgi:hypothetical protein